MASSFRLCCCAFLLLLCFSGACNGIRSIGTVDEMQKQLIKVENNERSLSFEMRKNGMFNFFPKGVPIPPSGPSKNHNEFQG
ncbi:hypothetical protein AMTRI_Chr04g179720 [Amborella trichopoda]